MDYCQDFTVDYLIKNIYIIFITEQCIYLLQGYKKVLARWVKIKYCSKVISSNYIKFGMLNLLCIYNKLWSKFNSYVIRCPSYSPKHTCNLHQKVPDFWKLSFIFQHISASTTSFIKVVVPWHISYESWDLELWNKL